MKKYKIIDLFAGVGGFRLAAGQLGLECVFTSEIDQKARETYSANFDGIIHGDITQVEMNEIPDHDILCAGFPCQPFSIAGKREGFKDTRGTLFFNIELIIKNKKPKIVFLENVKGLVNHDNGKTLETIINNLNMLGYTVHHKIMNTADYTVIPQNRERIFIIGIRNELKKDFEFPKKSLVRKKITELLIPINQVKTNFIYSKDSKIFSCLKQGVINENTVYQFRRKYVRENKKKLCPTLTANMGTGGHNVPIIIQNGVIRKLTPRECFLFQGYPQSFKLPSIANSQLYKQAGNSVSVPLIKAIMEQILKILK